MRRGRLIIKYSKQWALFINSWEHIQLSCFKYTKDRKIFHTNQQIQQKHEGYVSSPFI